MSLYIYQCFTLLLSYDNIEYGVFMTKEKELFNRFIDDANIYTGCVENKIISDISISFPYYVLKIFYKLSDSEISEALRGLGSHDYGLDAFFFKEDEKTSYFIQFKSSESYESQKYAEREWFLSLDDISKKIISSNLNDIQSNRIHDIIDDYQTFEILLKESDFQMEIKKIIFHMGECSSNISKSFNDIEYYNLESILQTYQNDLDEDSDEIVANLEINLKPQYPEMFDANAKTYIQFTQNSFNGKKKKSCIFPIPALTLIKMIDDKSTKLLERNVRGYLGHNNDVNKGIIDTAINHPESFYYFNNGISISCENLQIEDANQILYLDDPQIINGAQTVHSLLYAFNLAKNDKIDKIKNIEDAKKHFSKIHVLCRVMETDKNFENSGTKDKLTYSTSLTTFNNKQNKMKVTDFFSGNREQISIQNALKNFDVGYSIKRGKIYEKELASYKLQIEMETLGEMYLQAHELFPVSASKIFSKNFENNKDYQFIFDKHSQKRFDYYFITFLHDYLSSTFKTIKDYYEERNEDIVITLEKKQDLRNDLGHYLYYKVERFEPKLKKYFYALDYKMFFHLVFQVLQQTIKDENYEEIHMPDYIEKFRKNTTNKQRMQDNMSLIIPIALDIYAAILKKIIPEHQIGKRIPKTKKTAEIIADIFSDKMSDSHSVSKNDFK